ncbi:MAG TPA: VOC family protein [Rhizomicrobium sp.]|nr:VOC family protein [Rhizomicrobium sp.]
MQKMRTFLWFDGKAEEAARFYTSVFRDGKILDIMRYTDAGPRPKGEVLTVAFELFGQPFVALNGGAHYTFTPAVSFMVVCETQEELDGYWDSLADGGTPMRCGWITDRFGVTWQITPSILLPLLQDKDGARASRVTRAMMEMVKFDIAALKRASDGE